MFTRHFALVVLPGFAQILDKDFVLPIGKAKVMRQGKDLTITAFSKMVGHSLKAAEQLAAEGIDVEVSRWELMPWFVCVMDDWVLKMLYEMLDSSATVFSVSCAWFGNCPAGKGTSGAGITAKQLGLHALVRQLYGKSLRIPGDVDAIKRVKGQATKVEIY